MKSHSRFSVSVLVVLAFSKLLHLSQSLNGVLALLPPPQLPAVKILKMLALLGWLGGWLEVESDVNKW